ncbi:MAG: MFS transporter [Methanomassiliicoccales archaeon]|nr:MFS transporter [Methanomassiliicoccales archaeon]
MTQTAHQEKLSLKGNGIILAILAAMAMMVMFIEIMLVPALPHIAMEYPQDSEWVSWVLSAYLLSGAVATLLLGRFGDIYGKKRVMMFALSIYIIGLVGCAISWSMGSLIAFRAVQGVGMGVFVLAFGIIRDTFPRRLVPVAIGIISAMFSVGVSIGLLGGGFIVSNLSWRDAFYIVIPFMVTLTFLVWWLVQDNNEIRRKEKVDVPGAAMISGGVLSLLLALTQGQEWGWTDVKILGLFSLSAVLIFTFIWWEVKGTKTPIVSIKLMRVRGIAGANIAALFVGMSMFLMFQTLPFFLMSPEAVGGFGVTDSFMIGVYMFPSAVAQLIFAPLAGKWSKNIGADKILISGLLILCLGMALMAFWHETLIQVMINVFITGLGLGFAMVSMINVVAMASPRAEFGVASGMNTLFRVVGGSIGPVLASVITASFLVSYIPPGGTYPVSIPGEEGYMLVFLLGAVLALIGGIVAIIMRPGHGISYEEEHVVPQGEK